MLRHIFDEETKRRERSVDRYVQALDSGDADEIAAVLEEALDDPELDSLITEIDFAYQEEERLSPSAGDAELVRELVRRHLRSAFDAEELSSQPPTVGEVAGHLKKQRRVPAADRDANESLLTSRAQLPSWLSAREVAKLASGLGVSASERFWRVFRDAAITFCMGQGHRQAQLAARAARARTGGARSKAAPRAGASGGAEVGAFKTAGGEIVEAVKRACEAAGLKYEALTPGIVPLDRIISAYPLRVAELPDARERLTYRTAVKFLSAETGQTIQSLEEDDRPLSGFIYAHDFGGCFYGCVLTEKGDPTPRRRYSAAHELGHYLLHFLPMLERRGEGHEALVLVEGLPLVERSEVDEEFPTGKLAVGAGAGSGWRHLRSDTEEMELEANSFAAELLMPAHACRALAKSYVSKFGKNRSVVVRRLATEFLVSYEAMRRRLTDLGLYEEQAKASD